MHREMGHIRTACAAIGPRDKPGDDLGERPSAAWMSASPNIVMAGAGPPPMTSPRQPLKIVVGGPAPAMTRHDPLPAMQVGSSAPSPDPIRRGTGPAAALFALVLAALLSAPAQSASLPAVEAEHGMVVSAQRLAAEAGVEILRQGGNAVDAAVAVGYAEAVTNPCCGNIGGGGFLTAHLADGRDVFLDFRETAPAAATRDMYLNPDGTPDRAASLRGWKSVAVPGSVAGLDAALTRYGTMTRAAAMAPAIRLARDGFILSRADAAVIARGASILRRDPASAAVFLHPDGSPLTSGERLVQADLAATLGAIAEQGPVAFYQGRIPAAIEAASRAGGGIVTAADLAAYAIHETPPVRCAYRGFAVLSAPPPSSGGTTLCEILLVLEGFDLRASGFASARTVHLMTEAMRHSFADRNNFLGDPAFVANPMEWLLSPAHTAAIRAAITDRATPSAAVNAGQAPHEKPETTSYSVTDAKGNAVAVTTTINGLFGAGVMAPGTGFMLNDEMDDFTVKPGSPNVVGLVQGAANAIAPGKRPLSSMAPTVVLRDGKVAMVVGSPGGSRIITIVLQVLLNLIDHGMEPQAAVDAPRIHHQWLPDEVQAEPFALSADTKAALAAMGYQVREQTPWGAAALIAVGAAEPAGGKTASSGSDSVTTTGPRPGWFYGANDPRRPAGAAMGR